MGASASKIDKAAPEITADMCSVYENGPFWTTDGTAVQEPRFAKTGVASAEGHPPITVMDLFKKAVEKFGDKPCMAAERPVPPLEGKVAPPALPLEEWTTWTYKQYYDETWAAAKGMIALGHERYDAVNVFGFNSPEWFMAQLSCIFAGGRAAGIYPSDSADQVQYKSHHSGASVACLESESNLKKFASKIDEMPKLKAIVTWACESEDIKRKDGSTVKVLTWTQLIELGKEQSDDALNERVNVIKPGNCCCLVYTSGTTGNPKAVMISHDNIIFESLAVLKLVPNYKKAEQERIVSYLPLSHVAGMLVDIFCPMAGTAFGKGWGTAYFARPYDLKVGTIAMRLQAVKPTLFLGVPRVWEKIQEKIKAKAALNSDLKKKIGAWAKSKGLVAAQNCQLGGNGAYPWGYSVAEKLVFSKLKGLLGLEKVKFGFTGAAPITKETLEFYGALGIQVNEVYGMSECCGATTVSVDACHVWGSCGFALPGTEVKIFKCDHKDFNKKTECPRAKNIFGTSEEEEGEICFRGRHIMMGYLANPDLGNAHVEEIKKKNADAIDAEGWLHSGDKGCMSVEGMVKITGRYKELIITAGGENIAPVPIEDTIKAHCPAISNIMMIGDKRKYNVCLITLKAVGATGEEPGTNELDSDAAKLNPETKTVEQACVDPVFEEAITNAIKAANADGSCCPSNASKIQKFTILPLDVSQVTGEIGPTMKLKRGAVMKKYANVIEALYAEDAKGPFVNTLPQGN